VHIHSSKPNIKVNHQYLFFFLTSKDQIIKGLSLSLQPFFLQREIGELRQLQT
jgi:hypothetical protein